MEVKMSIRSQKNGIIRVEYRLVGPNTAPGKGRILGRIYFEKSKIDYRFVRFSINSPLFEGMIDSLLLEEEVDIYVTSQRADKHRMDYMRRMISLFQKIGYIININCPP